MTSKVLPALFIGHGSPMNLLAENPFTSDMVKLGTQLPVPKAIVVISAHWLTRGSFITSSDKPEQIYDFYGFPGSLYEYKYLAPGSAEIAGFICEMTGKDTIIMDGRRGIDHAAWTILKHMRPEQDVPVLEISLDIAREPHYHFDLGRKLASLRKNNILVIGSGNIIHNLSEFNFDDNSKPFRWSEEFDLTIKTALENKDFDLLINYSKLGLAARRAIPFNDHYLPMLYVLGMIDNNENIKFVHESIQNGSISMRSFIIG